MAEMMPTVEKQRKRSDKIWAERAAWDDIYAQAYDYAIPQRRPGGASKSKRLSMAIYDMTAPSSVMHGAGQLVRQLFGPTPFMIEPGPLLKNNLDAQELDTLTRQLALMQAQIYPFFQAGDFDAAIHETAIDLFVGTGAIMPMRGPSIEEPLIFVNIPFDQIATATDAWGRQHYISWKTTLGAEEIVRAWPEGNFSREFKERARNNPYSEIELFQDFQRLPDGRWLFMAYAQENPDFIVKNITLARPIAVPRFYKAPGEPYGRGPLLLAMPTIKTVNKAQELALKAAAIQMLGIWGFRAGGTFNPDAVKVGPGVFWPMQSTGGVLGPDVSRIDPATGRLDVARMVIGGAQEQIREALFDTRLSNEGGTPASAMEIAARLQQSAKVHIGAYGRLINEIMPVLVVRTIEILNEWGLVQMPLPLNPLLYSINVVSPMAMAMKADGLVAATNYAQLVMQIAGQEQFARFVHLDRFVARAREALLVDPDITPTRQEVAQADEMQQQQQALNAMMTMGEAAAPQLARALVEGAGE